MRKVIKFAAINRTLLKMIVICIAVNACSDGNPSYKETIDYISSKTKTKHGVIEHEIEFPAKCKMRQRETVYTNNGKISSYDYNEVDIKFLDPSKVKIRYEVDLLLITTGYNEAVKKTFYAKLEYYDYLLKNPNFKCGKNLCQKDSTYTSDLSIINFDSALEYAPKLKRAFEHLIKLCGGKEELFSSELK